MGATHTTTCSTKALTRFVFSKPRDATPQHTRARPTLALILHRRLHPQQRRSPMTSTPRSVDTVLKVTGNTAVGLMEQQPLTRFAACFGLYRPPATVERSRQRRWQPALAKLLVAMFPVVKFGVV